MTPSNFSDMGKTRGKSKARANAKTAGAKGGSARAAKMSPEARKEWSMAMHFAKAWKRRERKP